MNNSPRYYKALREFLGCDSPSTVRDGAILAWLAGIAFMLSAFLAGWCVRGCM